ncbi:MAG: phage tail sheath family protein [Cyanobacteria bacterium CRU_2_1]|nr:phage tail sheath family protein [Cyanobacteria bacterium RU_5_0]NJR57837.1 phage tail sheath family protein [Cyanobacteria bacterium CRU_2_1]
MQIPDSLQGRLDYDPVNRRLIAKGVLSEQAKQALRSQSSDPTFRQAVEALFQAAQTPITPLHRQAEFSDRFIGLPIGYLAEAITGFFENGGTRCYLVRADSMAKPEMALKEAIASLSALTDLDLIAVPDAMILPKKNLMNVQQALIAHCAEQGDRLAILDAIPGSTIEALQIQRSGIIANQTEPFNAALYYPWLRNTHGRLVPPCGHVAGIFARSDRARGFFKAPANEVIRDAIDLEFVVDNATQDQLNPSGINGLRAFPGRGIRVWGVRTLSQDLNWRYINVRRIFLTLNRWINQNMRFATFEPNSPELWIRIQRELSIYLTSLWEAGALQGEIPEQAFYVKCDLETNPPEVREIGQVITEMGLAATAPAEFIIVRITQQAESTQITIP